MGYVFDAQQPHVAEIAPRLEQFNNMVASPVRLPGLAGPNDAMQLIADAVSWVNFVRVVMAGGAAAFAIGFLQQLGKRTADRILDHVPKATAYQKPDIDGLAQAIQKVQDSGLTFALAIPLVGNPRNVGLQLSTKDPQDVTRQIILFGAQAPEIEQMVVEERLAAKNDVTFPKNDDCSTKVVMVDDGRIVLPGRLSR